MLSLDTGSSWRRRLAGGFSIEPRSARTPAPQCRANPSRQSIRYAMDRTFESFTNINLDAPISSNSEKLAYDFNPGQAMNLLLFKTQAKRDFSARSVHRNANVLNFPAASEKGRGQ